MSYITDHNILIFLVQFFLLLGLAKGLGGIFRKMKQPAITAEILVGVLLGPTIFGRFLPEMSQIIFPLNSTQQNMLETISWLGLLFFLLEVGLEVDFSSAWRQKGDALKIALTDIIVPLGITILPWFFIPDSFLVDPTKRYIFALFMATVMTITDMPITVRALRELGVAKTDLGFLVISALSVNDIIGWMVFTLVLGLFIHPSIEIMRIFGVFISIVGFAAISLSVGKRITSNIIARIKSEQWPEPGTSLTFLCLLGLLFGAISQKIGIHAMFGFFVAGVMAGQAKALSEKTRQVISQMVYAIFIPIFFASIGLKIDFFRSFNAPLILMVSVVSILAKFLGAWWGVSFTKQAKANRLPIAVAHTPGGTMQIVIGLLAFQSHLITESVFEAIVFGAVISSVIVGPWLNWALKKRKEISILEFFSKRGMLLDLKATDRNAAIRELCELTTGHEDFPAVEEVYKAVVQREEAMGTGLEKGVAVPHARLEMIKKPLVIVGRSLAGIDWNSPDGKPTNFVFLTFTPNDDDTAQIQLLASIAKMMIKDQNQQELTQARDREEMWLVLHRTLSERIIRRK
ncbi:MAG: cation:proton antiporter [bacterium]|nr:cation:proton antiporter [bacterium]